MNKPILEEKFADNGEHSHWELINEDGEVLWSESETPYSKAWSAFRKSKEYHTCMASLFNKGILYPYSANILRTSFDFAWNEAQGLFNKTL